METTAWTVAKDPGMSTQVAAPLIPFSVGSSLEMPLDREEVLSHSLLLAGPWCERLGMGSFTKKDLVREVSSRTGLDAQAGKENVDCFLDVMCEGLGRDGVIEIRRFGIFRVKDAPERAARNPRTDEAIRVPAKKTIHFKPGLLMKERLKQAPTQHPVPPSPEKGSNDKSLSPKPAKKEPSKPSTPSPQKTAKPAIILPARE
jgi:integration host factor subunit beta